jgi:hypothetical protein
VLKQRKGVVWEGQQSGVRKGEAVALVDGGRLPALGLCVVVLRLGEENGEVVGGADLVVGGQSGGQIVGVGVVVVVAVLDVEPDRQVVGLLDFDSRAEGVFPDGEQSVSEGDGHWRSGGGVDGLPDGPRRAVN